ncbi:hypothetical protein SPOG_01767 [Schizosaccharomyces cryophilus OY26]|uniref:Uncharacterized protein n=1 Tax=Schizosaccharomyces cryophilus (strain OY26 / ATCC MYA-4695 / CBS 11777 / NBRC 106824 / NRRL Y48691) TaxID=653667 RepID=S9VXX1_SCHCR|nr:uncharacterized protein SPOG_01767 [Schizosaccharomyces cryophilus OY26]EPY52443.1 hypothetical protein SPOG_01767 [Schizosaccharomyces cryophilus OY26]
MWDIHKPAREFNRTWGYIENCRDKLRFESYVEIELGGGELYQKVPDDPVKHMRGVNEENGEENNKG